MTLDFDVDELYSIEELRTKGLELVRFHSGFSIHYYENEFYIFKHYRPVEEKPHHRFGFKTVVYTETKNLKEDK